MHMSDMHTNLKEFELDDNHPIYNGYLYVIEGEVRRAKTSTTVGKLKKLLQVQSIRNCDIGGRNLWDYTF